MTSDDELLAELRAALRGTAAAPPQVVAAAKAAFVWRSFDDELAALTADSLLDDQLVGVREGSGRVRSITFEADGLAVELEVDLRGVVGQLLPPQRGTVAVRGTLGSGSTVEADDVGRFVLRPLPAGPVSLRCSTAAGRSFVTSWVSLSR